MSGRQPAWDNSRVRSFGEYRDKRIARRARSVNPPSRRSQRTPEPEDMPDEASPSGVGRSPRVSLPARRRDRKSSAALVSGSSQSCGLRATATTIIHGNRGRSRTGLVRMNFTMIGSWCPV